MQHWPKTESKLSSIAFLSIIFWRIRKSVYLYHSIAPTCGIFFFFPMFSKHAAKLSFYRMLKTRTSCSIFKFYCMKFHSSCSEYFVKSKKPQHAALQDQRLTKRFSFFMNHESWIHFVNLWKSPISYIDRGSDTGVSQSKDCCDKRR